ncbi:MAG: hypothetical protein K6357_00180 [Elusimicrobiota bacterium]
MSFKPDYIPEPQSLERKVFNEFELNILFNNLNWDMLFLRFFNLKKSQQEKINETKKEMDEIGKEIIAEKYLKAKGIYQIFKIKNYTDYIELIENEKVIGRIEFNKTSNHLLSDFLADEDFLGVASVSVFIDEKKFQKLFEERKYRKLYIINSISIMMAESFIEVLHYFVQKNFKNEDENDFSKFPQYIQQTKRYSPGYPSIDIKFNKTLHEVLKANEIGSKITESYMIEPESSVQAIILHNPKAFYI